MFFGNRQSRYLLGRLLLHHHGLCSTKVSPTRMDIEVSRFFFFNLYVQLSISDCFSRLDFNKFIVIIHEYFCCDVETFQAQSAAVCHVYGMRSDGFVYFFVLLKFSIRSSQNSIHISLLG